MKSYDVKIYISGFAVLSVNANSEKEAIHKAWDKVSEKLQDDVKISEVFEEVDCYKLGGSYPAASVEEIED